jgi:Tfp pilus assembly protein PilX
MPSRRAGERGVVLFVALIVLVVMSLAAVVIARSVFTGNRVAGNLAFQQSATQSADIGVETAVAWLEQNAGSVILNNSIPAGPTRYLALRQDPDLPTNQSWENFWQNQLLPFVNPLPADAAGNTAAYVIQRMCNAPGDPATGIGCNSSPIATAAAGSSKGAGVIALISTGQVYYRITVRVAGPRNAVSFVQAMVAI